MTSHCSLITGVSSFQGGGGGGGGGKCWQPNIDTIHYANKSSIVMSHNTPVESLWKENDPSSGWEHA